MLISWNWLKEYVVLDMPADVLTRRLMMAGLNHESTTDVEGDIAVDLEVTSNRPDCLGHLGIAREVAVVFDRPLKRPLARPQEGASAVSSLTSVTIECNDLCPRYTARVIRGVKVGPSPAWLRRRLNTIGLRSINNVVDVTNYVMMECGQPLHAFDMRLLRGQKIVVRRPRPGETIEAIDHKVYPLDGEMCVIADAERAIGLGGVMGGADSEVSEKTANVLVESAQFSPISIRGTARKLKLHSPSSYRFERGLDPEGVDWASRRCCELILHVAGGELASGVIDVGRRAPAREKIVFRHNQVRRVLGIDVELAEITRILEALGNKVHTLGEGRLEVIPPSWRNDLEREIDLLEEVARIHGYEKIPEDVQVPMAASARTDDDRVFDRIRRVLTGAGFDEALTLSALPAALAESFSPWSDRPAIRIQTPIVEDADLLRKSLVPSLLIARRHNESVGNQRIELFELARAYLPQDGLRQGGLPREEPLLAICGGGDFFAVKAAIEAVLESLDGEVALEARDLPPSLSGSDALLGTRSAELWLSGQLLGYLGEVSPAGAEKFELRGPATVAELKVAVLLAVARLVPTYKKPPEFPPVVCDVNLKVDEAVRWSAINEIVQKNAGEHLADIRYHETYRSPALLNEGKKKVLFQVSFRSSKGTLTHEQVNQDHARIVQACGAKLGAELG